jgi:hypothetical protein
MNGWMSRRWNDVIKLTFEEPDSVKGAAPEAVLVVATAVLVGLGGTRGTLGALILGTVLALRWRDDPVALRDVARVLVGAVSLVLAVALLSRGGW